MTCKFVCTHARPDRHWRISPGRAAVASQQDPAGSQFGQAEFVAALWSPAFAWRGGAHSSKPLHGCRGFASIEEGLRTALQREISHTGRGEKRGRPGRKYRLCTANSPTDRPPGFICFALAPTLPTSEQAKTQRNEAGRETKQACVSRGNPAFWVTLAHRTHPQHCPGIFQGLGVD